MEEEDIRATVYDRLGRCSERIKVGKEYEDRPFRVDPTKVNSVVDALRSLCLAPVADMPTYLGDDPSFPAPTSLIALQNGLLDIDAYLKGEPCLRPHTPLWLSENCLPFAFDPEATCPTWDRFIPDVMSDDEESSVWLQKWVGLQLVPDLSHQIIAFLPGTGGNGKGVFLDVLQALLGRHNYCTPTFSSICERFGRSEFSGKLSAIMGDAHLGRETDAIRALEFLKSVSGGTPVNLEEKGKPMRSGIRLNARFTIAVNILPRLPDASRALGRRIRIIPFHRSYTANPDRTLGERMISSELPGILLWALEGLRKLRQGATLDQPAVGESIRADFIDDSSPISAFIENYCEVDPEYSEAKAIFRHALNLWLEQSGHKPMADSTISRQIRANNSRINTDRKRRVDGKPKPIFVGIRLNADGRALYLISDFRSGHYPI
jgi:putative DNA primase/helicase